jgi:transposase-like protein
MPKKYLDSEKREALALYFDNGMTQRRVEGITGIPKSTINNWIIEHNRTIRNPPVRHKGQRYSEEEKAKALALYANKSASMKEVCELTGIKYSTIKNWVAQSKDLRQMRGNGIRRFSESHRKYNAEIRMRAVGLYFEEGKTLKETGAELGVAWQTVNNWIGIARAESNGELEQRRRDKYPRAIKERALRLYFERRLTAQEVSELVNVKATTIKTWARQERAKVEASSSAGLEESTALDNALTPASAEVTANASRESVEQESRGDANQLLGAIRALAEERDKYKAAFEAIATELRQAGVYSQA